MKQPLKALGICIFFAITPNLSFAQKSLTPQQGGQMNVDSSRYNLCMQNGDGNGRVTQIGNHVGPQKPEDYCKQWAGPSRDGTPSSFPRSLTAAQGQSMNINYSRYNDCMQGGMGNGRNQAPQDYCKGWAGPAH